MLKEKTFSNAYLFYPKIYNLGPEEFASHSSLMDTSNELLALVREEYKEQNSATDVEPSENGDVGINSTGINKTHSILIHQNLLLRNINT